MVADTIGDVLLERLRVWGLRRVVGYSGDGINGIVAATNRYADPAIGFTQVRHEEQAAFTACAHGKYTGDREVSFAPSGPGAMRLLAGRYDTLMDHRAVWPELQRAGNDLELERQDAERYVV